MNHYDMGIGQSVASDLALHAIDRTAAKSGAAMAPVYCYGMDCFGMGMDRHVIGCTEAASWRGVSMLIDVWRLTWSFREQDPFPWSLQTRGVS